VRCKGHLYALEGMAHHGNKHVDENNDNGDVVQRKQERADSLDHWRRSVTAREADRVLAAVFLGRVFDFDAIDVNQAEHRPK